MKRIISLLLACALGTGLLAGCGTGRSEGGSQPSDSAQSSSSGQPDSAQSAGSDQADRNSAAALGSLAHFTAGTLDGGSFTQDDIGAKDVTVVNFWALSCGPCIVEMPDLAEFAGALPDNVQLVTVCLDGSGSEEAVREVLDRAGFQGITIIAGDGDLGALANNLMYTPTTVFADSEGSLVGSAVIGRQADLSEAYLEGVNRVLKAEGKDEISLES